MDKSEGWLSKDSFIRARFFGEYGVRLIFELPCCGPCMCSAFGDCITFREYIKMGVNIERVYMVSFGIGAALAGLAGCLLTPLYTMSPQIGTNFILPAFAVVVLGGLGSQLGTALAALVMIGGFEVFRDLQEYRMLLFGGALVLIMVLRPRGLVSGRTPSVALGKRREISAELVAEGRG